MEFRANVQVKELLKSGLAEKNDLLGAAAGIARQDCNLTEPLVITRTLNIFFCLFVSAAAVPLTLSRAIVQWWPSSAFLLSLFAFLGLLQQSFHNPQYFSYFLILLFHFIRPPHSYSYLSQR